MEEKLLDRVAVNSFDIRDGEVVGQEKNVDKENEIKSQLTEEHMKQLQEEFKKEAERLQAKFQLAPASIAETIILEDVTPEEARVIIDDKEDLYAFTELMDGMGLSASQLGISKKYFVARDMSLDNAPFKIYFNPKYFQNGTTRVTFKEGCLTYPNVQVDVKRWKNITFHWYGFDADGKWKKFQKNIGGLNSIILQHEVDHNGNWGNKPITIMTKNHKGRK